MSRVDKRIHIGIRKDSLQQIQAKEERLREKINELCVIAERTCATSIDVKRLLASPLNYIVNTYRTQWLSDKPEHIDFLSVVQSETNLNINEIQKLDVEIKNLIKSLGQHAPKINAKGMISGIDETAFDVYLNDNKTEEYKSVKALLSTLRDYKNHSNRFTPIHFLRGIQGLKFNSDHTFFELDFYYWSK